MTRMRRVTVTMAVLSLVASAEAQDGPDPAEPAVQMDTLNVRDTLYHLSHGGGNSLVLIDEINGGVVLVDTKRPGQGAAVQEVIGQVTDLPVTTIIATHAHPDHAGAISEFPTVTEIIAHEYTAEALSETDPAAGTSRSGLATTTFPDRFSLLDDLDRIELYYFGAAHTAGDIVVVFPEKGVAYLGDLFPSKATPVIDTDQGGSGVAFPDTLEKAVAAIDGVSRVITGHGPFPTTYAGRGRREQGADRAWTGWMTWDDFAEYAEFNRQFLTLVDAAFRSGRTIDEAVESLSVDLPEQYAAYGMEHARANVKAIYDELASGR